MKRTFTAAEKRFVFDSWKNGIGFSDIAKILDSKPGTIFTILRDTGGIRDNVNDRRCSIMLSQVAKFSIPLHPTAFLVTAGNKCPRNFRGHGH
ncbi:Uncharacterised protein [Yersinia intermedia]|nr:Uncharacterised protein [Yersinia intermedia]CNK47048.1 Uncharacterised protein [Yersinia intermedia]